MKGIDSLDSSDSLDLLKMVNLSMLDEGGKITVVCNSPTSLGNLGIFRVQNNQRRIRPKNEPQHI